MSRDIKITFTEKELVTIKFNQIDRAITADLAGDVTGSPSDNTVVKIRGKAVDAPVAGDDGKAISYDATNDKFILDTGAGSDEKIKISSNDTTSGYLNGKLVAGTGITLTENNNGANETLSVINSDKGSTAISTHEITYDHSELHAHSNKTLLDSYTQTEVDIADAISKEHAHANKSILDNIEQAFTTTLKNKLDGIEALAVALTTVKADTDIADAITKKHTRSHAIDSSSDHTSTITQNNLMDADSNGLPDDSGLAVTDVSDAITKKHTQNTDTHLGTVDQDIAMNTHKLTGLSIPGSAGDSIRQTTKITEANLEDAIDKRNKANTFTIGATGCDYTTIQSALDAQNSGEELFLVYTGTYTDDTIHFTANDQCIVGVGLTAQQVVTTADANIVDFGAYTNCRINNIKITLTDPDSNVDAITGTTGDLMLRWCHLGVTVADKVDSVAQPSAINVTGIGSVTMTFGTIDYDNVNAYAGSYKAPILLGTGATVTLRRVIIDVDCSGTAIATMPVYGSSTGEVIMYRCTVTVVDNDANFTVGFTYLSYSGVSEFSYNDLHITNNSNTATALYLDSTAAETITVRTMYNHLHVLSSGGNAYSARLLDVNCTWISQLDDIIAANSYLSSGTVTMVSSEDDGDLTLSGNLTDGTNASTPADIKSAVDLKHTQNTDIKLDNGGANEVSASNLKTKQVHFSLDGSGAALTTGVKSWTRAGFSGTIVGWELTADKAGDIVIDVWKDVFGNFPPTVADTIIDGSGAVKPTLSSARTNSDDVLTGWSTTITAGDYLMFNVDSVATVTKIVLILEIEIS